MAEAYIGEIKIVAFNFAPRGWAGCNGQLLSIAQNTALFSLLGTTYGGNGQTTFALPNMQGCTPMQGDNTHTMGQMGGTASVTILSTQVPAHTHALACSLTDSASSATQPAGRMLARATAAIYADVAPATALSPQSLGVSTGGSLPHSNMQPYLALNIVIALQGIFPAMQ